MIGRLLLLLACLCCVAVSAGCGGSDAQLGTVQVVGTEVDPGETSNNPPEP